MDFSRLRQGEIVAGLAGGALIIFLFLPWFGAPGDFTPTEEPSFENIPGIDEGPIAPPDVEVAEDVSGWDALTDIDGFLIAAAGAAGIALACLAAAGRRLNLGGLPRGTITAVLGALAAALILWRMFAEPVGGEGLQAGIFLGFAAAVLITVGALIALREGGFQPLVAAGAQRRGAKAAKPKAAKPKAAKPKPATSPKTRSDQASGE